VRKQISRKGKGPSRPSASAVATDGIQHTAARPVPSWLAAVRERLGWEALLWAGVAMLVLSTVSVVIRTYTPVPKWDYWAEILWLKNYYAGHWSVSDLWRQHNEHRILFPRLFFLVDLFLFKGTNVFSLVSMLLLQAGHAWIFIRELRLSKGLARSVRRTAIAITIALLFSGANLDNFTWPFQVQFILVFYAGTAAIYSLIRHAEAAAKLTRGRAATGWLAASLGSALVASYSLSSGVLIWPVLLLIGLSLRLRLRILLVIAGSAAVTLLAWGAGYQAVAAHPSISGAIKDPIHLLAWVAGYLALPLSKLNHEAGLWVGGASLIAVAAATFWMSRRPVLPRLVRLAIGVMVFITLNAFVTGLGRMALGPAEAAMRYATPVCVFWACAFFLVLLADGTWLPANVEIRTAGAIAAAITCLVTVILPVHLDQSRFFTSLAPSWLDAQSAMEADVAADEQIRAIYPAPETVYAAVGVLRAHRLSLFAHAPVRMGEALYSRHEPVGEDRCRGVWETTTIIDSARPGEIVSGWAWDNRANRAPEIVLIADDAGEIHGLARFTRTREDVANSLHSGRMTASGWFGFAQPWPGHPYRAYAVLADGKAVCALRNVAEVRRSVAAVFRHGHWTVDSNKSDQWEPEDRTIDFGLDGDIPVSGDWDGTGVTRAGVFRNGEWFLDMNNNGHWDEGDRQISFGATGDRPVVGDWNHTGVTKLGVFRNGKWFLDWNGNLQFGSARTFNFGLSDDIPVVGDWDGSGKIRVGVFRRGEWYLDMNGDFQSDGHARKVLFGLPGDQPVTGDWNGLGTTRIGVFRNGQWIFDSKGILRWDPQQRSISFGLPGDIAVPWE